MDFLAALRVHQMSENLYQKHAIALANIVKSIASQAMKEAGEIELAMATEAGNLADDGVAEIAVELDCAYSQRSYGPDSKFGALSGAVSTESYFRKI